MFFCEQKCLRSTVRCLQNTLIFFLFLISSFFKGVPHSLSLDRFLFCCCECVNRACQMFARFRKCSQSCKCVCNVCENVRMVQKFVPKKLGRRFSVDILIIQLQKCLRKCSIISQMCKNVCKFVKVCKNFATKNFVWGG